MAGPQSIFAPRGAFLGSELKMLLAQVIDMKDRRRETQFVGMVKPERFPEAEHQRPLPTDAQMWIDIEEMFDDGCELIQNRFYETDEQARDKTAPAWLDDDAGTHVRPWMMIPFIKSVDYKYVAERVDLAWDLIPSLKKTIKERALTVQFLKEWALFNDVVGAVRLLDFSKPDDMQGARRSKSLKGAKSVSGQVHWVAVALTHEMRDGKTKRHIAEQRVAKQIRDAMNSKLFRDGRESKLFAKILGKDGLLKTTYRSKNLPQAEIDRLCALPRDGLPPLDLGKK